MEEALKMQADAVAQAMTSTKQQYSALVAQAVAQGHVDAIPLYAQSMQASLTLQTPLLQGRYTELVSECALEIAKWHGIHASTRVKLRNRKFREYRRRMVKHYTGKLEKLGVAKDEILRSILRRSIYIRSVLSEWSNVGDLAEEARAIRNLLVSICKMDDDIKLPLSADGCVVEHHPRWKVPSTFELTPDHDGVLATVVNDELRRIKFPSEWTMMELAVRAFLSPSEHDRRVYYRQLWHHLAFSRTLFLEEMLSNFDRSSVVHRLMAMLCDKTLLHGCTELYREDDHLRFIRNTAVRRVAHLESIPGGRMRFEQPMTKRCAFMFYSCCIAESSELIELMHGDLIRWPGDPYLIAHFVQATVRVLLNEKEERVCLTREQRAVVWDWLYSSITELNGLLCRRTLPLLCSSVDICDYCPRKKVYVINPSPFMQLLELQITDPHSVDYNPLEWRLAAVVTSWIATDAFSFDPDSDRRQVQQCRDWLMRVGAFYYDDAACEWLFRNVRDSGDAAIADGSLCILLRSPDGVEWGRRVFRETLADSGSDFVCLHNPIVFFWTMVSLGASVEHDADSTRTLSDAVATLCRDANDTDTDTDTDADRAEVTRASRTLTQHLQRHRLELFEPFAQLLRQHTPLPLELIDEVRDYSLCAALPRVLPRVFRDGFIGPRATREIIATPNSDWHLPVTSRRPLES
ncbi:MAG: hypothetical protein MHM6MM_002163 [Cercozoa sp. M6MM]